MTNDYPRHTSRKFPLPCVFFKTKPAHPRHGCVQAPLWRRALIWSLSIPPCTCLVGPRMQPRPHQRGSESYKVIVGLSSKVPFYNGYQLHKIPLSKEHPPHSQPHGDTACQVYWHVFLTNSSEHYQLVISMKRRIICLPFGGLPVHRGGLRLIVV